MHKTATLENFLFCVSPASKSIEWGNENELHYLVLPAGQTAFQCFVFFSCQEDKAPSAVLLHLFSMAFGANCPLKNPGNVCLFHLLRNKAELTPCVRWARKEPENSVTHPEMVWPKKHKARTWALRPQVSFVSWNHSLSSHYLNTFWIRDIKLFLSNLYLREFMKIITKGKWHCLNWNLIHLAPHCLL